MKTKKKTLALPPGLEFKVEFIDEAGGDPVDSIKSVEGPPGWVDSQWGRRWILANCDLSEEGPAPIPKPRSRRRKESTETVPDPEL